MGAWDIFEFFLDLKLDTLHGQTADMLRLQRYADCEYEKSLLRIINKHTSDLILLDCGFRHVETRQVLARFADPAFRKKKRPALEKNETENLNSTLSESRRLKCSAQSKWY